MGIVKALGLDTKGTISVDLGNTWYFSGEIVTGTIYVTVNEPLKCGALVIKASGTEHLLGAAVQNSDGEYKRNRKVVKIFSKEVTATKFAEEVQPGTYSYPFELQLPDKLPGVFTLQDYGSGCTRHVQASISYSLEAKLGVSGFLSRNVSTEIPLAIYEPVPAVLPPSEASITKTIRHLAIISKGNCSLAVKLDTNVYHVGDTIRVQCTVQNDSEVEIRAIRCKLKQDVTMKGNLFARPLKQTIVAFNYAGVATGQTASNIFDIELPELSSTSSCGRMLTCTYRLKVECDVPMCPDLVLYLPVTIVESDEEDEPVEKEENNEQDTSEGDESDSNSDSDSESETK